MEQSDASSTTPPIINVVAASALVASGGENADDVGGSDGGGGCGATGDDKDKDNVSIKSSDSVTTSGEYEIVPETPQLNLSKDTTDGCAVNALTLRDRPGQFLQSETLQRKTTMPLSPILNMAGDMQEMEKNLTEVIKELDVDEQGELIVNA